MSKKFMEKLKEIAKENYLLSTNNVYLSQTFTKHYNSELSDLQKKIIFFALSNIKNEHRDLNPDELSRLTFYLKVDNFIKLVDLKNKRGADLYNRIKEEIKLLQKTPVQYIDFIGGEHSISWFSRVSYYSKHSIKKYKQIYNNNSNLIELTEDEMKQLNKTDLSQIDELENSSYFMFNFTENLCCMLVNLKKDYTKYNFLISHNLKPKTARVYELLQTWKTSNKYITTIDEFCNSLSLSKTYFIKSQLKKYVLEKVKEELNKKLNMGFDYSFEGNKLILTAQKNDNDLCKEIFDVVQKQKIDKEKRELNKLLKQQEEKEEEAKILNEVYI